MKLTSRKAYLTKRVSELEQSTRNHKSFIDHLRMNIMQDDLSQLLAGKITDDEAKDEDCPADGDEASDTKPVSTSAMLSDAQRLHLTQQAMVTVEMLQRLYDRDYLLQKKMEEALRIIDAEKTDESKTKKHT